MFLLLFLAGRGGLPHKQWQHPSPVLTVAPWMALSQIVGQITPRAVQAPNQTLESAIRPGGLHVSDVHELQETDDLARISHMLEVVFQMLSHILLYG